MSNNNQCNVRSYYSTETVTVEVIMARSLNNNYRVRLTPRVHAQAYAGIWRCRGKRYTSRIVTVYHHQMFSESSKPFFPLDGLSGLASALFLPLAGFSEFFDLSFSMVLDGILVGVALATFVRLWTLVGQHW